MFNCNENRFDTQSGQYRLCGAQDGAYRLFICEFGLVDENGHGPCTMTVLEDIFEEAWGEHELQAEDSSEQAGSTSDTELKGFLVRFQFLEVMVRIAIAKYVKVQQQRGSCPNMGPVAVQSRLGDIFVQLRTNIWQMI